MNGEQEPVDPAAAGEIPAGTRPGDPEQVTQLLANWSQGDRAALEKLTPLVYGELRRLAHHYMEAQRPEHTLQTTALVNEAYLRLADQTRPNFANRSHFFAVAAKAMRKRTALQKHCVQNHWQTPVCFAEAGAFVCQAALRNSLYNHALAKTQSRRTVTAETFSTSAISSSLSPPKYLSSTT